MKNILLSIIALFLINQLVAQSDSIPVIKVRKKADTSMIICASYQMPEFKGGEKELFSFLRSNIVYPDSLKEKVITETVYCEFVVEKDGNPSSFKILRYPHPLFAKEVLRVMKLMPKWNPSIQSGKAVEVKMVLPVHFRSK